jgi:SAM-dependent methyltransferase
LNYYEQIQNSDSIPQEYKYYWGYQYRLGSEVVVPYLSSLSAFRSGDRVMEIGSAEGGVLAAFVESGANDALATDIAKNRLDMGDEISKQLNLPIDFREHNILEDDVPDEWKSSASLVILRDVIEHLDDTFLALSNIRKFIKPGGFLYVTFPPYYSPFGGHQHNLMNFWGKLPYIHYLPDFIFKKLIASGRPADIDEVTRLRNIRMSPKKFLDAAKKSGYELFRDDYYLLRPVFKMKFGLPAIKISALSFIPVIRNFFSLEASFILRVKG